jgi:hypothetical protein
MPHLFLSDDWIAAARAIREQHGASTAAGPAVRMNLTVTGVPFGAGTVQSYIDTSSGTAEMELGQLEEADVSLTTDYDTARTIFVLQDQAAGMQAFMTGKVVVQGDMMQLLALNASLGGDPRAADVAAEIFAMTE